MRRRQRALATVAVAAAALTVPAQALAHANLVGSSPADGSRLSVAPREIVLEFDESVSRGLSSAVLSSARTGPVSGVRVASGSGSSLVVSLPELSKGAYILDWRSASADDLHATSGTVTFGVGVAVGRGTVSDRQRLQSSAIDLGEVLLRWGDFGAIAVLIGALALFALCVPRARGGNDVELGELARRLTVLAVAAGTLALVTGLALLVVQADAAAAGGAGDVGAVLTGTTYGLSWIARELLIVYLLVLALRCGATTGVTSRALVLAGSVALCFALAASSHSASARGTLSVAGGALALHVFAAAVWAGGVCVLAVLWTAERRRKVDVGATWHLLRPFSGLAVLCVSVVALTGIYTAGVDVSTPAELLSTFYGRVLLLKTSLFVIVGLVGFGNSLLVNVWDRHRAWLGRGLPLEAAAVTAVFLMAAVLTSSAPARTIRAAPYTSGRITSMRADSLLVSLSVTPDRPGVNFVKADVYDSRRPASPIEAVDFSVARRPEVARWRAGARIDETGWQVARELGRPGIGTIHVRVRRRGVPAVVLASRWKITDASPVDTPAGRQLPSNHTLAAIVTPVAAGGGLALIVGVLAFGVWKWLGSPIPRLPRTRLQTPSGN